MKLMPTDQRSVTGVLNMYLSLSQCLSTGRHFITAEATAKLHQISVQLQSFVMFIMNSFSALHQQELSSSYD
jgi:hypothetical protein